ncbi:MAG: ATP-binding cassette domain-containing protein [Desulfobacterales bacterium]|jgi:oligopeptide/dipeptide ABC transporter ATP-binding protein|nr:ATP-binding cassette domain-containing protein [Desulfobacterales bacterium]
MPEAPLLEVIDLAKHFPLGGGIFARPTAWVRAVAGVSFAVRRGERFGLVGESGCGKTTVGRLVLRLLEPTRGRIEFDGQNILALDRAAMGRLRRRMQIIFQDPYSSLDPRMTVEQIVTEPLRAGGEQRPRAERRCAAAALLEKVGLRASDLRKYPHEFSGGQRQRIGIARALCVRPELIVADEPVSALDVSVQAQVINLLQDLGEEFGLAFVFISHDLGVVQHLCERIAVMYLGAIVELAPVQRFSREPRHPYTEALLAAVPLPDPRRRSGRFAMEGDVPSPIDPPAGCAFHPRCRHALDRCRVETPPLIQAAEGHAVACWLNDGKGLEPKGGMGHGA